MKDGKRPAEDEMSSWKKWNLEKQQSKKQKMGSYALRQNMEKARPSAASQEKLPEKKLEAPPPLTTLYVLEDPAREAWYKLELTYKASFPLKKLRRPLVPLKDDATKNHSFCIHGLQEVSVDAKKDGYQVTEQKCRLNQYFGGSPRVIYYRELMSEYWSCLGKKFDTDEAYYEYQNAKHNLSRYPRERFLLNTLILGGGYINLIEGILKNLNYVVGPTRYNCLAFVNHLEASLGVKVEVAFVELPHRLNCPLGIVKICVLLNDSSWKAVPVLGKPYVLYPPPKPTLPKPTLEKETIRSDQKKEKLKMLRRDVTGTDVFLLEDFRESVRDREEHEDAMRRHDRKARRAT